MDEFELFLADGTPVGIKVVIPPFTNTKPAEALQWGSRFFFWTPEHKQYREGLLYWVANEHAYQTNDGKRFSDVIAEHLEAEKQHRSKEKGRDSDCG